MSCGRLRLMLVWLGGAFTLCGVHGCGAETPRGPETPASSASLAVPGAPEAGANSADTAEADRAPRDVGQPLDDLSATPPEDGIPFLSPAYRVTRAVTPRTKAARPLFARCVLHAGSAKRSGQKVKLPDGGVQSAPPQLECAFDAECVRREVDAGAAGGDDGFASLQCKGRQCICRLIAVRKQGRPEAVYEESFELEDGCGDPELSRRLLEEICMRGMPRALNSKRP